jgi:CheY-like chemotaxis protein
MQIHQVLVNLLVNARDAMPQGGTLRIAAANLHLNPVEAGMIPGARPGAWLTLEVSDTGTGIPPGILSHIWEPFFTTKGEGKGTGLGLSTVHGIIANHYGFVELRTEVGRGTTFRVFLPAVENVVPANGSATPFALPKGHDELVLVVDDDKAVRDVVTAMLQRFNYHVLNCCDGMEAIRLFSISPDKFALVITDVDMPRLGGVALAQHLLTLRPDIRLLAMSGLSRVESDKSDTPAMRDLAHAFLIKPFKVEDLLLTVNGVLHPPPETSSEGNRVLQEAL